MTGGRDRGEVKDFAFDDAQVLIRNGHAVSVNFNEADPLAKKLDFEIRDEQSQIVPQLRVAIPQRSVDAPAVTTKNDLLPYVGTQKVRRKP
jgi:hypothetical protein